MGPTPRFGPAFEPELIVIPGVLPATTVTFQPTSRTDSVFKLQAQPGGSVIRSMQHGSDGQRVLFLNLDPANSVFFTAQSGLGDPLGQFFIPGVLSGINVEVPPFGSATFYFDGDILGWIDISGASGGNAALPVPATINDLVFWFRADLVSASSGTPIPLLQNSSPPYAGNSAAASNGGALLSAVQLNSLNTLTWSAAATGRYNLAAGFDLTRVSLFVVINPAADPAGDVFSGAVNSFEYATTNVGGSPTLYIGVSNVAVIAISTTPLTVGSWAQANVAYDAATGIFSFRQARAPNGNGVSAHAITALSGAIGYQAAVGIADFNGSIAEFLVYNRVLTAPEIATVESYLNTKWGV